MIENFTRNILLFAILLASDAVSAFQTQQKRCFQRTRSIERAVSSTYNGYDDTPARQRSLRNIKNVTNTCMTSIQQAVQNEDDSDETLLAERRQKVRARSGSLQIRLPLDQPLGFSLCQVAVPESQISSMELDLDTIAEFKESTSNGSNRERLADIRELMARLDPDFRGLVVASIDSKSMAYREGVRPGDIFLGISATLGDSTWPKSTLEGVKAALDSRKLVAKDVAIDIKRTDNQVRNQYELTLRKPLGIEVQETEDGYVEVTGFTENAPNLVKYAVRIGDRVLAVDASLGGQLWPVSTVEGLISATTSRLPGAPVTLRFERPQSVMVQMENATTAVKAVIMPADVATERENSVVAIPPNNKELLKRCRDVLRRYSAEHNSKFKGKYSVPAIVADKVVDALASASVSLDSVTLNMIMGAYLSCDQPDGAIRIFEAAVGLAGDASATPITDQIIGNNGGRIVPRDSALSLYTATALLHAHAMRRDLSSMQRVLAALEGNSGHLVDGIEAAPWPWTGPYGTIQPDTPCYNVALSTVEKCGEEGIPIAYKIFDKLKDPSKQQAKEGYPVKDAVTFNTMISILSNCGRSDEAFLVFDRMKRVGIRPDKYTYTSLIKACTSESDVEELMYDMRERGVKADVVTYNTMIRSLCDERKWTQATKLVTEMESRGVSPDERTYSFLMNAMLKADKPNACLALFESACADERTVGLTENVYLYTIAITAASMLGRHERACELVARMTASGVKPNIKTMTAVLGACLNANDPDLAVKIFERIEKPDGLALMQGIQAYCDSGDHEIAAKLLKSQNRRSRMMTGKQVMSAYKTVVVSSVQKERYNLAKDMMNDLLSKGFVPNKAMLHEIINVMKLNDAKVISSLMVDRGGPMFTYLLSLIDSLQSRRLEVDGNIYAATLSLGASLGGLYRKIACLLSEKRVGSTAAGSKELFSTEGKDKNHSSLNWEELFLNYDKYKNGEISGRLSPLPVQISARNVRRVLKVEQAVSYNMRSKQRRLQTQAKS